MITFKISHRSFVFRHLITLMFFAIGVLCYFYFADISDELKGRPIILIVMSPFFLAYFIWDVLKFHETPKEVSLDVQDGCLLREGDKISFEEVKSISLLYRNGLYRFEVIMPSGYHFIRPSFSFHCDTPKSDVIKKIYGLNNVSLIVIDKPFW